MQTKQELEVSIGKLKERVKDDKTPPAIKKTLQMAIDKAEKQLGELIEAEKLAKSPKVTPKQADKIDDVKQDSKDMVADLKAKLSKVKAKTKAKSVRLTNEDRKRVSKSIRKKQGLSTKNDDVERDAGRPALPKGMRISKNGNKYYEYRENRIDRRPQKYAKLEEGGTMSDGGMMKNGGEFNVGVGEKYYDVKEKMNLTLGKETDMPNVYYVTWEDGESSIYSKSNINFLIQKGIWKKMEDGGMMAKGGGTDIEMTAWKLPISYNKNKEVIYGEPIILKKGTEKQLLKFLDNEKYVKDNRDIFDGRSGVVMFPSTTTLEQVKKYHTYAYADGGEMMAKGGYADKELYNVSGIRDGVRVIISKKPLTKDEANELINDAKRSGLYQNVMLSEVDMYGGEMKRGGKTDYKYVPNQQIAEVTVEKNGKETIIDGSKVLDGIYVKGGVRFMEGGDTMPEKEYMVFYRSSNPAYVNDKGFGDNPPDIYYADSMFEVMEYLKENMPSDVEIAGIDECEVTAYGHGGSLQEQNYEMLLSKVKEVKHHAEELEKVARQNKFIDAWVVAKATRSATDLSDITHYLDGKTDKDNYEDIEDEDEMKMGGAMERYANGGRVMAQYEKVEGTNYELKIQVFYNMGGMNYFNYKNEERGYYLSVTPVQVERQANGITIESYMAFSGVKELLLPVKRKSEKAEQQAIELAKDRIPVLKQYILDKMKSQQGYMEDGGMMGDKYYNTMSNVGKSKYVVNYHDGVKTHKDGSPFKDIAIFKNKIDNDKFVKKLESEGYKYKMANGGMMNISGESNGDWVAENGGAGMYADGGAMAMGGKTSFKDKVNAISKRLEGKKVPKRLQKDYGKTYNKKESKEAGKRIAGSMKAKYGI
jgi:hypothetical protein